MKAFLRAILVLSLAAGVFPLFADNFLITYAEGQVELKQGALWKPVAIGALLPDTSVVRVGADGLLEIKVNRNTFSIYQSGTYALKSLIQPARDAKSGRLFAAVDEKIKTLAGQRNEREKSSAAGVRGKNQATGAAQDLAWGGDQPDPIPDGQKLIEAGKYREAVDYFLAALKADHDPAAEPALYYYLSTACDKNGEAARAVKYANKIVLNPDDPQFAEFALYKGTLLAKSFSFPKALDVCAQYLLAFPAGDNVQDILLLSAYCYRNTGDAKRQKDSLQRAVTIDPNSDLGKEAAAQLKSP